MARWFIVTVSAGVSFRDPMPVCGTKSAHDPFHLHRCFHISYASVEFVFFFLGECGGAWGEYVGGVCVAGVGDAGHSCCIWGVGDKFAVEFCYLYILGVGGSGESFKDGVAFCCRQGQGIKMSIELFHDCISRSPMSRLHGCYI